MFDLGRGIRRILAFLSAVMICFFSISFFIALPVYAEEGGFTLQFEQYGTTGMDDFRNMLTQNSENHFGLAESNFKYWGKGGVLGTKVLGYAWDSVDKLEVTKDDKGYHFSIPAQEGKLDSLDT